MLLPLLWTCVVRWKVNDVCVTSCMDSIEPCVGGCAVVVVDVKKQTKK
jgi:hypothetical protein